MDKKRLEPVFEPFFLKYYSFNGVIFWIVLLSTISFPKYAEVQIMQQDIEISVEKAKTLAKEFLEQKKIEWGTPTKIILNNGIFILTYSTPDKELIVLGRRTLTVNAETGEIKFPPRF